MFENPRRQASKKFYNKCSENSRSQIVFRTDIFPKIAVGCPCWETGSSFNFAVNSAHTLQICSLDQWIFWTPRRTLVICSLRCREVSVEFQIHIRARLVHSVQGVEHVELWLIGQARVPDLVQLISCHPRQCFKRLGLRRLNSTSSEFRNSYLFKIQ